MYQGWIKLHRGLGNWEWFQDRNTLQLFIFILINANHKENKWQGTVVPKGCLITGRKSLASKLGLTEQQVRTSLNKLKSTSEITIKTTNKFSLIKLNNWEKYQAVQPTNNPTDNQQITTNKNDKNDKNNTGGSFKNKKPFIEGDKAFKTENDVWRVKTRDGWKDYVGSLIDNLEWK